MSKLLETFQELNLSNYGPDDVDQLNAWAIDAYAELSAPKAQEPVAEFFALDDGIGTIMAAWADGFEPVVGQKLYAAPVISAKQQVALPEWAPCNPGCDPEFNGQRSAGCARYCENARAAMLAAAPAAPAADAGLVDMYRHLQKVTPYRFKKIQDASVTDGGDVLYFHQDRFDAALLDDMAAHRAKGVES